MNIYKQVKEAVSVRDAAYFYGLEPNRSGMVRCPFHNDRHPSMKVDERKNGGFYCFGCGASGDVISFTGHLFSLSPYEAAMKLSEDFGIVLTDDSPVFPQSRKANRTSETSSGNVPGQSHRSITVDSMKSLLLTRILAAVHRNARQAMLESDPDSPDCFSQEYADALNAVQLSEYYLENIEDRDTHLRAMNTEVRHER